MAHHESNEHLSPVELEFRDALQHADDFLKIQLLRPARKWYLKALEYNIETEKVKQNIETCDRLIVFELKVIRVLVVVAAVIITVLLIIK